MSSSALDIPLYGKQFDFVNTNVHYAAMVGGIGSGKSLAGCVRGLLASQGYVGGSRIETPNLGVITAPTYPMLRDATIRTFRDVAGDFIKDYNRGEHTMLMRNGSEILFRSTTDPELLRGPSIRWWFGDEAALYRELVWRIMMGRLRQHGQRGFAWLATTPKGRNWIWQKFIQKRRRAFRIWKVKTWENPFLDPDFVLDLMEEYTGDFALQELEGEFIAFEGLIYAEFSRDTHVTTKTFSPSDFVYTVAGVDWGFAKPGVIKIGGVDGDGRITMVHEEYARRRRIEEWVNIAVQLRDIWGVETWYCDPSEPDYIRKFQDAGLRAEGANNEVNPGIQAVKNRLVVREDGRPRLMQTVGCVYTATEYEQYQWMENKDGIRDQPKKANDHCMDTDRYAVMGVEGQPRGEVSMGAKRYA